MEAKGYYVVPLDYESIYMYLINDNNKSTKSKIYKLLSDKSFLNPDEYMSWLGTAINSLGGTLGNWKQTAKIKLEYSAWSGADVYEAEIKNKKGKVVGKLESNRTGGPASDICYYFVDTTHNNDKSKLNYNDYGIGVVVNKTNEHILEDIFNKINK